MPRQPVTVATSPTRENNPTRSCQTSSLGSSITTAVLQRAINDWLLDCEYRLYSPKTLDAKRCFLKNLIWFLEHRGYSSCGSRELKEFLYYLRHGHEEPGGRFGNKWLNKPVRPETVKDYWVCLNTFCKWLVNEDLTESSPMGAVPKPVVRTEEKQPLTPAQVKALLRATRQSQHPRRDEAIVLLLLDTGIRCSELTGLKIKDVDLRAHQCVVLGKGNKIRTVHFGTTTGNALRLYLRSRSEDIDEPLFLADKSGGLLRPLTDSGLRQLLERLGLAAGISRSCSAHVLRRTFAVTWLRNGANIFSLQSMLGHSDLRMTQRYLSLANADIAEQARQFSPADKLKAQR
jgi:site-specific recombinase XerD